MHMYSLRCICPCVFLCGVSGGWGWGRELREREVERMCLSALFVSALMCALMCVVQSVFCDILTATCSAALQNEV